MPVQVSQEILNATTKCPHEFSCLDSGQCGKHKMCEVDQAPAMNILFLKSKENVTCPYRTSFAYSQICTCPTHFTINRMKF
jgi:hypothetical protein